MKILRNGHLVGQLPAQIMQDSHKNIFEEGCNAIFVRWTALQLAIQNEWGGFQSQQKAEQLYKDVLNWFYTNKGIVRHLCIEISYSIKHASTNHPACSIK